MPPAVAQNSSGSLAGLTSTVPVGVASEKRRTWVAKLESRGGSCRGCRRRVPADADLAGAGGHRDEPAVGQRAGDQVVEADAAADGDEPRLSLDIGDPASAAVSMTSPPAHCAASP